MQTTYELKRGILFMEKVVMHEEEKRLRDLFESVQYDSDLFKVYVAGENTLWDLCPQPRIIM